ncbi:MAG: DUF3784 domain-containing protein [Lachnospiraceae bacterium]|nr:DUF3784 domain-containing protein [Lachnospiraceae bacterium]
MNAPTNIATIICLLLAIAFYVAGFFQLKEKGFLLNNAYIFASQEERQKMNKKPYYRQSGITFCLVGTLFLSNAIYVITEWPGTLYPVAAITLITIIYALISTILIETKKSS